MDSPIAFSSSLPLFSCDAGEAAARPCFARVGLQAQFSWPGFHARRHIATTRFGPPPPHAFPPKVATEDSEKLDHKHEDMQSPFAPNSAEVQSLLMEVCDETSIAELKLKVGAFSLHMKRDIGKTKESAPMLVAPPVPTRPMLESIPHLFSDPTPPKSSSNAITTALATTSSTSYSKYELLVAAADEGLTFVTSPKVGIFKRCRVVKGKAGRPLCEVGRNVKQGQVVCYVEQLGTQQPIEAEASGEIVKVVFNDGDPISYGDPLIAIRPVFPGIK